MASSQGASVVLGSRQQAALEELATECERLGGKALAVRTDTSIEEDVSRLADEASARFGRIDVWVNNAAVGMMSRFEDAPPEAFRKVIETNFFGYVHGARTALRHFRQNNHGILINIASEVGKIGVPLASAYVASKFAVTGLSESLRMELRDEPHIRVSAVFPSAIDTPFFQHAANYVGKATAAPPPVSQPEAVAEAILKCIKTPRREVFVGNVGSKVALRRLAPALAEKKIAGFVEEHHFLDQAIEPTAGIVFAPMPELNSVHGGWTQRNELQGKTKLMTGLAMLLGIGLAAWAMTRTTKGRELARRSAELWTKTRKRYPANRSQEQTGQMAFAE